MYYEIAINSFFFYINVGSFYGVGMLKWNHNIYLLNASKNGRHVFNEKLRA